MARGPKHHLKRIAAPNHWKLDKLTGVYAPRPSSGPHKLRECMPLIILLRNKLKYALTGREVQSILMNRLITVDGRVRTDSTYPAGFMDVISIAKTNDHYRLLYDVTGRFAIHKINDSEATFKLCRVTKTFITTGKVPVLTTHDGRTLRYPDPAIKKNDTVKIDIASGTVTEHIKMGTGNLAMVVAGHNLGRVGLIVSRDRHPGKFDIVHVRDASGKTFATRLENVFIIGRGTKSLVSLPKRKGVKKNIIEDREYRLARNAANEMRK
jgi:small subunit ribosomal protein S4e